jgi:hypothetical protein
VKYFGTGVRMWPRSLHDVLLTGQAVDTLM